MKADLPAFSEPVPVLSPSLGSGLGALFCPGLVVLVVATSPWVSADEMASPEVPSSPPAVASVFKTEKLAQLDAEIERAIEEGNLIGGTLWVEHEGVAYHKAYGWRALAPEPEPMTEDTIFDLASITKVMATAAAAMGCVDRDRLDLDEPVCRHLPEFTGEGREKITPRHLLLHSSGLPVNLQDGKAPHARNRAEAFAMLCREKPRFEPGSAFSYSSTGSILLALVIEKVTGRSFDEFCVEEIYRPLGMNDTVFRPEGERLCRVAPSSAPQRGEVDDTVARHMGGVAGHASLFSTTADMAKFARMMLGLGELKGVRVLKAETVRLMTSVQSPPDLVSPAAHHLPVQRGLGWDINTPYRTPPHPYSRQRGALFPVGGYGHAGWTGQMLWVDPFSRSFVIFLCNRYGGEKEGSPAAVYQLHDRLSTHAAEALQVVDFSKASGHSGR